jgi:SAM-dependent methyltransferase
MTNLYDLADHFGNIDIYLFDQLLKRRIAPGMAVFDAGCGRGRNIHYLLRAGHQVYGVDLDSTAIDAVRALAAELAPELPPTNFRMESLESNSFPDNIADMVICSAVLHFASNEAHFAAMLDGVWRVLASGGICFVRLASTIGLENEVKPLGSRRYILPDGSERFLVDAALLERAEEQLGAQRLDPLKTTVVQDLRAMTTWVLRKPE